MQANSLDYLLGGYERDFASQRAATGMAAPMGKDEFLKLLVTQLEHQDPLNPMEDREFTAQLAQFSSLEQLTNISEGIQGLQKNSSRQEMLGAVSFIGKDVRATGDSLSKSGEDISTVYYHMEDVASKVYVNIFDAFGNLVRTVNLDARQPGDYEFVWDGKTYTGSEAPDGVYSIRIAAEGIYGQPVMVDSEVTGRVAGVQNINGQSYLRLEDGRQVNFMDIKEVVSPGS
ncbi:flagellar hook assembly protein FlgD [Desulfovulcanus sp.]